MEILTNKGRSSAIRIELKKLGYNSRQVSVRSGYCGYSDYTDITIKDLKADRKAIEKACKKFQSIDYDSASGEILQGANTFINVKYDYGIMRNAIEEKIKEDDFNSFIAGIETEQKTIEKSNANYIIYKQGDFYCMVCSKNKDGCGVFIIHPTDNVEQFKYSLAKYLVTDFNY